MLKPLQEWVCDTCGEIISKPDEGYVEWICDFSPGERRVHSFRIVHHAPHSPFFNDRGDCYKHTDMRGRQDTSLERFVDHQGIARILNFFDAGPYHDPDYSGPEVKHDDMRDFVEICRRLQIPYYEEARMYWEKAIDDGYFDGGNQIWLYQPDTLRRLVERYGG